MARKKSLASLISMYKPAKIKALKVPKLKGKLPKLKIKKVHR
jgi:hypothetical protein